MKSTAAQRAAATARKRAERSRYKDAGLKEVIVRIPNNPGSLVKLRGFEKKLQKNNIAVYRVLFSIAQRSLL